MTDNPVGYAPVVGDILQGGQAIYDFSQGDWKNGLLNASLLVVPNVVEKPLKLRIKAAKSSSIKCRQNSRRRDLKIHRKN